MKKKVLHILQDYSIITLSCLLYAFSFNCFFQQNNLAMGGFTGNSKNIVMCAAKSARIARIKALVKEIDPEKAFVIVTDAKEVYGEGFGEYRNV